MNQKVSRATPKKSVPSGRSTPRNRRIGKRSGRNSGKGGGWAAGFSSLKIAKPSRFVLLVVWLVAVAALGGLIYWGKTSKPLPQARTNDVAAKPRGASSEKAFDHRETPKPAEARRQRATPDNGGHQSAASTEKHTPEPRESIKPKPAPTPAPAPDSRETHTNHHYVSPAPEPDTTAPPAPRQPSPVLTPPVARVAIVIDDFGPSLDIARRFLELPIPVTLSVLPHQQYSQEIAELAHARHRQVILHLPMEPQGYPKVKPGKGALLLSMSGDALQQSLGSALDTTPYSAGINNHMGSRFTENAPLMKMVLGEAKKRHLYFLDSYTSPRSVAAAVAREVQIPFLRRDIFLDNNQSEAAVRKQIRQTIRRAKIQGAAVAIGHPHEATLRALGQEAGRFEEEKVAVVPAGELVSEP